MFWYPNYEFRKPEHAEKELQDMCRGTHSTSVLAVGINRPVGMEISQS